MVAAREEQVPVVSAFRRWKLYAVQYVRVFAMRHRGDLFTADEVIHSAFSYGLDEPPDRKHWGQVFQEAEELGIIANTGSIHSPNPRRRGAMTTLWRSTV
jgi:hypothetical protein